MMKKTISFLLSMALGLSLAACGSGDSAHPATDFSNGNAGTAQSNSTAKSQSAGDSAADPLTGATDEMTIKATEIVINIADPHRGTDHPASILIENLYDTLVRIDKNGDVVPHLAESWDIADDGKSYTFHIRQGVKFHDGSEVKASDVAFSMDRILGLGEGFSYLYEKSVDHTEVVDDYTVIFHLKVVYAPFVNTLIRCAIVNEEEVMANADLSVSTYGEYGDWGVAYLLNADAGSGPYTIVDWIPSDHILCDRHDDYWGGWETGTPEAVKFIMVEGTGQVATIMTMLSTGETDVGLPDMSREDKDILESVDGVATGTNVTGNVMYLMYNTQKAPTDCKYFRMALNCMLDYATITEQCYLNAKRATAVVSQGLAGASTPDGIAYEYSLEKAQEYLTQSKYYGQFDQYPVDFTYNSSIAANQKVAMMLQAAASTLGVTIEVTEAPWVTITDKAASVESTMNVTAIQVSPSYWEAGSVLESRFTTATQGTWQNTEWLGDTKIDDMVAEAFTLVDDATRYDKYHEIINYISELYSCAPLCENSTSSAYKADRLYWPVAEYMEETGEVQSLPMGYMFRFYEWRIRDKM